jgi:outer membrane protein assembly factor BamB
VIDMQTSWILAVAMVAYGATALGADPSLAWPQFRGPNGSGVADGQKPPVEIGPEKNVKWKVAVPSGLSSPIVAGENLVMTAFENGKLYTIAYRRTDGKEEWRAEAPAKQIEKFHKVEGSPAASTPATDGQRIVSYFGSCGLVAYDLAGKELWKFELPPATVPGDFGSGVSPIISDGLVLLVRDQMQDSRISAVDVATGSQKWSTKRLSMASYCTPVVWDTPEGKQIAAAGHARMFGYDLKSGTEKWSVGGVPSACCSSPVVSDGILYFAGSLNSGPDEAEPAMPAFDEILKGLDKDEDGALSRAEGEKAFEGFFDNQDANKDGKVSRDEWETIMKFMAEGQNTAFALKAGGTGDVTKSHVLWSQTKGLPYIPSAIIYDGKYVMVRDGGIVTAYDAKSGKQLYTQRVAATGRYYASPVAANGNIYLTSLEEGVVTVIKAGTDKPEVVATSSAFGERIAATPAIADDTIYIRTATQLYAFAEKK